MTVERSHTFSWTDTYGGRCSISVIATVDEPYSWEDLKRQAEEGAAKMGWRPKRWWEYWRPVDTHAAMTIHRGNPA